MKLESNKLKRHSFKSDEDRRAILRAELDVFYAKLYGLTRDDFRYILDPKDVYGPDFPGETFRVLKEKEEGEWGEYRTKRIVVEIYDGIAGAMRSGVPYKTCIDPAPGPPETVLPVRKAGHRNPRIGHSTSTKGKVNGSYTQ